MSTVPDLSQRKSLDQATTYYQQGIERAQDWLAARGIPMDLAVEYRLGVVGDRPCTGHEPYIGRLVIPYLTRAGVVTMRFRALDDSTPKYLSLPRDTGRLYNTAAFFVKSPRIVICEGELDALVVTEYAGVPAVGIQGAAAWRPVYRRCFAGYRDVLVAGDGDEAGRKFTDRIVSELDHSRPITLPEGADCNSLLLEEGPEGLASVFSGARAEV